MAKYQKRPIVVEAVKWTGANRDEMILFCPGAIIKEIVGLQDAATGQPVYDLLVPTPSGNYLARVGDYIIKGVKGEFYPCYEDDFNMVYDKVGD